MPLTIAQAALLQLLAEGALLFHARNRRTGADEWHLSFRNPDHRAESISVPTIQPLVDANLIERAGQFYWRLSAAGKTAIAPKETTTQDAPT